LKKISVVIPTHNRKSLLKKLLSQLKVQKLPADYCLEIIVVVDGSSDGTLEMLSERFPNVHVIEGDGTWWYTKSMNEGFKYAETLETDLVLMLNDDTEVDKSYISDLLNDMKQVGVGNSIMGSLSFTCNKPKRIVFAGIERIIRWRMKGIRNYGFLEPVQDKNLQGVTTSAVLPGRGMLVPMNILREVGYFDETFKQYSSDYDFVLRARKQGFESYISLNASLCTYIEKTSNSSSFIKEGFLDFLMDFFNPHSRRYIPSKARYLWRHGFKPLWPLTFFIFLLGSVKSYLFNPEV